MAKAIEAGIPKMRIEEAAARTQARIDSGQQTVIGVNKYRVEEDVAIEVLKVDNAEVRRSSSHKLARLRAERDEDDCRASLEHLTRAARPTADAQPARAGHRRSPGQGDRRRDLRGAGEGLRPLHRAGSVPSAACTATRLAPTTAHDPRPGPRRGVRGDRGPPSPHPRRQDGPGRPRPRPEGDRHRLRRPRLRRRRGPAVPDARRGRRARPSRPTCTSSASPRWPPVT